MQRKPHDVYHFCSFECKKTNSCNSSITKFYQENINNRILPRKRQTQEKISSTANFTIIMNISEDPDNETPGFCDKDTAGKWWQCQTIWRAKCNRWVFRQQINRGVFNNTQSNIYDGTFLRK